MKTKLTGKLQDVQRDWKTNKLNITFQIEEQPTNDINLWATSEKLSIEVDKYRQKRSLDANGLLWMCLGEMANVLRTDKWDIYLTMLKRYGQFTYICVKPNVVDAVKAQWRECEEIGEVEINGKKAIQLLCYFGSSTYDSREFSILLDGVKSEMEELGLTPPASEEMRRAIEQWERRNQS